jgi:hypothetical protein
VVGVVVTPGANLVAGIEGDVARGWNGRSEVCAQVEHEPGRGAAFIRPRASCRRRRTTCLARFAAPKLATATRLGVGLSRWLGAMARIAGHRQFARI